ncbi:glycosyltransferase family 4 protein [Parasphingorhabdus sp. DH2-15]|uniref:glycosyltransferase family 4 protein n=1 Tax=Parasphingorhabdus sp. DH2-15 TaxID=3444112 RepID=UPI003F6867DA
MTKTVRILHLHSTFDHGGKEARCVQLINAMGPRVHHDIVSAIPGALGARKAISPRSKVRFPEKFPSLEGKPAITRYRYLAIAMKAYDLILTYNWGSMDAVMAHTIFGRYEKLAPLIHHEDGFNSDEQHRLKRRRNWFRTVALSRSAALVVPSKRLEHIAHTAWHQPKSRVQLIPNGIALQDYSKKPQKGAIPGFKPRADEVVIGTVAGLRSIKNIPRLVELVAKSASKIRLVIVGEGPEKETIAARAQELGIADSVLMPGFLPNPARYVGLFDIFALTSDSEQFPISLMEAMAAGLPVIATDVGDVAHMISSANGPYIARPDDMAGLQSALDTLVADTQLRDKLGAANLQKAKDDFDEQDMIARYAKLYSGISGKPLLD